MRTFVSLLVLFVSALGAPPLRAQARSKREPETLRIEILPGEREKWIDTSLSERVPVAIFGSAAIPAAEIDPSNLVLAGAAASKGEDGAPAAYRDVDGDGLTDIVVGFISSGIRLADTGRRAVLSGRTRTGRWVSGSAEVATVQGARNANARALRIDPRAEKLPAIAVRIDVLPNDPANRIELGNRGTVPVALLSAPGFDARTIDPLTLALSGAPVTRRKGGGLASVQDVNGDGFADLIVEVPKRFLQLGAESARAVLTGVTRNGRQLRGSDDVSIASTATMVFDSDEASAIPDPPGIEFASTGAITINDNTTASPYPSTIAVGGVPGVIAKVRVTLKRLSHTYPDDMDILLVGPTGQSLVLMSDAGGIGLGVSNVTLTFDDDSSHTLDASTNPLPGTYRPINIGTPDVFPGPAPAPSAASTLSAFNGTSPNGAWSLYVFDDNSADSGTIADGWALDFVMAAEFCGVGPITIGDNAPAVPYPYPINVSGLTGVASKVTATLKGFTHTFPQDVDVLLISPGGITSMLMSDTAGGASGTSAVDLVLDDNAPLILDPMAIPAGGTYQTQDNFPGDSLPAPAPAAPYTGNLNVFRGSDPNGVWTVWVADDSNVDVGTLSGVCLSVTTMTPIDSTNLAPVTIPSGAPGTTSGPSSPYPSSINVGGVMGTIAKATVRLNALTHTYPNDLDVLLVPPPTGGGRVILMSDAGGGTPGVTGVNYTFDDDASSSMPIVSNAGSGTYRPTNDDSEGADTFPGPAPAGPYSATLGAVIGVNPNGTWSLYIVDDAGNDVGTLGGGWTLTLTTTLTPQSGCNFTMITIPAGAPAITEGVASAYPAGIIVNTFPGELEQFKVTVTLLGLTHTYPSDLDVLLVGPRGQKVVLMSDAAGGAPGMSGVTLTLDDDAAAPVDQFTNAAPGRYRPSDYESGDVFPAPAPPGPYSASLSAFEGTSPVGGWQLYIADDASGDYGNLVGWCLAFEPSLPAGEVPGLRWTDKTTLAWNAGPSATSYVVYRGNAAALPALDNQTVDACLRGTTITQTGTGVSETPASGTFFWYIVVGKNAQGEGPPGFEQIQGAPRARILNSSGACP